MVFADKPDKLPRLIGTTVNVYAPTYSPGFVPNGRLIDRIVVSKIKGTCVCGTSLVTGNFEAYDAQTYVQFFNAERDDNFMEAEDKLGLDDLYSERD